MAENNSTDKKNNEKKKSTKSSSTKKTTKRSTKASTSKKKTTTASDVVADTVNAVAKSNNKALQVFVLLLVVAIVAVCVYGYFAGWFDFLFNKTPTPNNPIDFNSETYDVTTIASADMSIHFMELGNKFTGDSIFIKAGDVDILIDAGSRTNSADTIEKYVRQYCTDNKLEYVIATHADTDHISGFAGDNTNKSIFERFEIGTFIDFAKTNKTTEIYKRYVEQRQKLVENANTNVYNAYDCVNKNNGAQKVYNLTDNITMEVLDQKFYSESSSDENNYSVCLLFTQGEDHYLFTGDLEEKGEESLVEKNPDLPKCVLFKAGHHGSKTSSNDVLLQKIQPDIVCVCCCAGSDEYKAKSENTFPTQAFVDRVSKYTENVYVTSLANDTDKGFESMNGNIVFASTKVSAEGTFKNEYKMYFTNNATKLKDTDWFKNNRTMPSGWKKESEQQ